MCKCPGSLILAWYRRPSFLKTFSCAYWLTYFNFAMYTPFHRGYLVQNEDNFCTVPSMVNIKKKTMPYNISPCIFLFHVLISIWGWTVWRCYREVIPFPHQWRSSVFRCSTDQKDWLSMKAWNYWAASVAWMSTSSKHNVSLMFRNVNSHQGMHILGQYGMVVCVLIWPIVGLQILGIPWWLSVRKTSHI